MKKIDTGDSRSVTLIFLHKKKIQHVKNISNTGYVGPRRFERNNQENAGALSSFLNQNDR